ncbi:MAG: hypothetical protein ABFC42_14160 [Sulfuricella sp.]
MRTESISRRLATLEAKVAPKISGQELRLLQSPVFAAMLGEHGVSVEDYKRRGFGALPRDLLRALVERLKVANAAS